MPKENHGACEVQETREIGCAPLVAGDESARVLEPGEESFDLPPARVAPERPAILREVDAVPPMGCDQFDVEGGQEAIERIAVVRGVADDAFRVVSEKTGIQGLCDELGFVR